MKLDKNSKNNETWKILPKSCNNGSSGSQGTKLLYVYACVCVCVCWGPSVMASVREGCICCSGSSGSSGSSGGGGGVATHTAVRSRSNACNCVEIDGSEEQAKVCLG